MINIVYFGKPRGFESYEFEFGESMSSNKENAHIEPLLIPKRNHNPIFHYFVKESYACFEYYTYTKGFDADRDGSVFGIGIKTDKNLSLFDSCYKVFKPFGKDLEHELLDDNNKFIAPNIIDVLKRTEWSTEEQQTINSTIDNTPFQKTSKDLLLLVVPDFSEISMIESQIKEYSDVYIADNQDIFNDSINRILLEKSKYKIFTLKGGNIVEVPATVPSSHKEVLLENESNHTKRGQNIKSPPFNQENRIEPITKNKHKFNWITRYRELTTYYILGLIILIIGISFYHTFKSDVNSQENGQKSGKIRPTTKSTEVENKNASWWDDWIIHDGEIIAFIILGLIVLVNGGMSFYCFKRINVSIQIIENQLLTLNGVKTNKNIQSTEQNDKTEKEVKKNNR